MEPDEKRTKGDGDKGDWVDMETFNVPFVKQEKKPSQIVRMGPISAHIDYLEPQLDMSKAVLLGCRIVQSEFSLGGVPRRHVAYAGKNPETGKDMYRVRRFVEFNEHGQPVYATTVESDIPELAALRKAEQKDI